MSDTPLHAQDPTRRFSTRAADYVRFRPSYPAAAIDAVLAGLGDPHALVAADIGAGTGISARLLAERGVRVLALEPNEAMQAAAEPYPNVQWLPPARTAEATGLEPGSLDLILCAQAFHWFRHTEALAEFARILRPGGRVALVWNNRDPDDALTSGYGRAILEASGNHPAARRFDRPDALFASPLFRNARECSFPSHQDLDCAGLVGRATSASYIPTSGPAHDRLVAELGRLFDTHARNGAVALHYRTNVYLAERV